ncbi:MAG: phospho-N-acetylmuramoyl-pentapeptide-transferase [candidate division KSB1 bacterium]|nr:phospho-N-acetylmuramoyl-pentapeptide-transferase [candidate division KSB1 bacterium]
MRSDGPASHQSKKGTPSMGGVIILISTLIPVLLLARIRELNVLMVLVCMVALGLMGWYDDYLKLIKKMPKGLVGRYKLAGQISIGFLLGCSVYFFPEVEAVRSSTTVPFFKNLELEMGAFYILVVTFIITATSNSANLTDGLDGMLSGLTAIAAVTFGAVAYVTGRVDFSSYLNIVYLPNAGELTVFCAALFGSCLAFLWFNAPKAEVFMGDTGSLALGGAIGAVSVLVRKELLLPIICGLWLLESLSVIIQVYVFKRTGKRVFLMAPLHHHYELNGWNESKVVIRFWIIGILLALLTLTTFKIR